MPEESQQTQSIIQPEQQATAEVPQAQPQSAKGGANLTSVPRGPGKNTIFTLLVFLLIIGVLIGGFIFAWPMISAKLNPVEPAPVVTETSQGTPTEPEKNEVEVLEEELSESESDINNLEGEIDQGYDIDLSF